MPRLMLRFLSIIGCGLSALLCIAVAVMWVRALTITEWVEWKRGGLIAPGADDWHIEWLRASSGWGGVIIDYSHAWEVTKGTAAPAGPPPQPWQFSHGSRRRGAAGRGHLFGRFTYYRNRTVDPDFDSDDAYEGESRLVRVPHWVLMLATAVLPALWAVRCRLRARRRRRLRLGLCPRCGYDLRATPGRCPECGWERLPQADGALPAATEAAKDVVRATAADGAS